MYFKFCTDIPWSLDRKIINFVFSRNFILKKKFHLFVDHDNKFGNHFSVAGMLSSCYDHIRACPSHWVYQTPNIDMWIVYHSSCEVWASCGRLTGALWSRRSSLRFSVFVEAAKCAVFLIAIWLDCDEVLGQVLLQACGHWADLT